MNVEQIARVAHQVNRAYCQSIGDHSQRPWDEAEAWQRESAIAGVIKVIDEPDTTPKDSHEAWMLEKIKGGWTYGAVKDSQQKTHPCLVPYEDLPSKDIAKDYIFITVVSELLEI